MIVESSFSRFHAYWNVADCPKEKFGALQKALAQRFNGDPVVHDLPRVMRVPGFYHLKGEPFQTRIIECNSVQPYPLAEIVEKLKLRSAYSSSKRKNAHASTENSLMFPEGRRNAGLLGLAGTMRRKGMAGESIEIALLAENRIRCSPPLPENEVRQIALNGAKYVPAPTANHAHPRTSDDFWPLPILPGAFSGVPSFSVQ